MTRKSAKARLVANPSTGSIPTARIRNRPKRLAYIVQNGIDESTIHQIFSYNNSIWGGYFNAFIPLEESGDIRSDWWEFLNRQDPDTIIYVGDIEPGLDEKINASIQPYERMQWREEFLEGLEQFDVEAAGGISIMYPLEQLRQNEAGITESNWIYPNIPMGEFANYYRIMIGEYPNDRYVDNYRRTLGASDETCAPSDLAEYLAHVQRIRPRYSPRHLTQKFLNLRYTNAFGYPISIIIDNGKWENLFLYHALRFWYGCKLLVIVPEACLSEMSVLCNWIESQKLGTNWITLLSATAKLEHLMSYSGEMRKLIGDKFDRIEAVVCSFKIPIPDVINREVQQIVSRNDQRVTFTRPPLNLPVIESMSTQHLITEINLAPERRNNTGFIPIRFERLNRVLSDTSGSSIRCSRGELAINSQVKKQVLSFTLPSPHKVIKEYLHSKKFKIQLSEKGKYYKGMLRLLGGLENAQILGSPLLYNLLSKPESSKFRKGTSYSVAGFKSLLKSEAEAERGLLVDLVSNLLQKSILLRGYEISCPHCDLTRWYALDEVMEIFQCAGCLSEMQMPTGIDFSYRLNELFIRGIDQGARTVLLTLITLQRICHDSCLWDFGYLLDEQSTDIDIIAICDGNLVFVECKDSISRNQKSLNDTAVQISQAAEKAAKAEADLLILSTLDEQIPEEIEETFNNIRERYKNLSTHVFVESDLLRRRLDVDMTNLITKPALMENCSEKVSGWGKATVFSVYG